MGINVCSELRNIIPNLNQFLDQIVEITQIHRDNNLIEFARVLELKVVLKGSPITSQGFGHSLDHNSKDGTRIRICGRIARIARAIPKSSDFEPFLNLTNTIVRQEKNDKDEKKVKPEEWRTFGNVGDSCLGELIVHLSVASVEIEGKDEKQGNERGGGENGEGATLDDQELSSVGTAMAGDLTAGGVPDRQELGEEGGWARYATVVATELDEHEYANAHQSSDG